MFARCASGKSTSARKNSATLDRASAGLRVKRHREMATSRIDFRTDAGQAKNQSITQLLINPGNDLHLSLSLSPDGDMARTKWRLFRHLLT